MNSALIVIDVQNFYFPGYGGDGLYLANETKDVIKGLIDKARRKHIPVVYIQHMSPDFDELTSVIDPAEEIHQDILPKEQDLVVFKHRPSSFYETTLQESLQKMGVCNLYVCGMMSHMCVDTTVRAAKDFGYNVTLFDDACTTHSLIWNGEEIPAAVVHKTYMASLNGTFATVLPAAEF